MSRCCSCDAFSGYVAVMEWRRVHVLRPRASTSGGQSGGSSEDVVDWAREAEDEAEAVGDDFDGVDFMRVRARQSAMDVQVRHLYGDISRSVFQAGDSTGSQLMGQGGNERFSVLI